MSALRRVLFKVSPLNLFLIVVAWKVLLFVIFQHELHARGYFKMEGLLNMSGDAPGYFVPTRDFIECGAVIDPCRMPGFLPIYGPLLLFFGDGMAKNIIVVFQLIADIFSVWFLGRIAFILFSRRAVQNLTILLYGLSSFNSVYVNWGYGEAFHIFLLVFGAWAFLRFHEQKHLRWLLLSGTALTWSLFFRQITLVPYGVLGVLFVANMLLNQVSVGIIAKRAFAFSAPVLIGLSIWGGYNYKHQGNLIFLAKNQAECFMSYPAHIWAVYDVVSAFGGELGMWGKEGKWFHDPSIPVDDFPFSDRVFTDDYSVETLDSLRIAFKASLTMDRDDPEYAPLVDEILGTGDRVIASYKRENPLDYHVVNRLRLTRDFLFPTRLDNLPFPARDEMSKWQFGFKAGALLFLLFTNALGIVGLLLKRWSIHHTIVLSIVGFLIYLGLIEQRYFAPAHPFMVVSAAYVLSLLGDLLARRFNA